MAGRHLASQLIAAFHRGLSLVHWGCRRPDGLTRRTVPHVRRRHLVLWQLSPQWRRLASSSPVSLHVQHWSLVQIQSPAAQRQQDRGNLVWLQVEPHQAECGQHDCSSRSATIQPSAVVRDLGFHLDSELSMKHHVAKVAAVCFYHLRGRWQIRRRVGTASLGCCGI